MTYVIREQLAQLEEMTGGYDFATVVARYWQGDVDGDEDLKSRALRWLRGEYTTRTDARRDLGVRSYVDDAGVYDHIKLLARFVRAAGYQGLLVELDELANLYKIPSAVARQSNYEQLLRILNDTLQGSARHLGFVLGGTPEFLMDTRRGLYSYQALQSRLAENAFARDGLVDQSGPVVRLANLTPEDLFVLLTNLRRVLQDDDAMLPDEALTAFMARCQSRVGDAYFRTPRNTVREFVNLLAVLAQNPDAQWETLLDAVEPARDEGPDDGRDDDNLDDDGLDSFQL